MEKSKIRQPAVAGQFYSSSAKEIKSQISAFADWKAKKQDVIGCVLPHAGYMYSGAVAANVVSHIKIKENIIIMGPNHTGFGPAFSIMSEGSWQTPLGTVEINNLLAKSILKSSHVKEDTLAHAYEHSIEVQLPFLQFQNTNFKIVPLVIGQADLEIYKEVGEQIANAIIETNTKDSSLIIASSDMTHYESQESAGKKDKLAIDAILALDETKLWQNVQKFDISMCGYAPTIIMLVAAKKLGAKKASLIKYQTSGDATGDYASVVGYAGIIVY